MSAAAASTSALGPDTTAEMLWYQLRNALANFETVLKQIIETRAWEPLGYDTFAQAWADRMRGHWLGTTSTAAVVVYELIESGMDREQALLTLGPSSGVGPAKYDVLAEQHALGVSPDLATMRPRGSGGGRSVVRQHLREAPSEPHVVRVELTPTEYAHWKALADSHGLDLADEAAKAVRAHFRALERRSADGIR